MSEISLTRFKQCNKCKCTKPAATTFFHRCKAAKDGLQYRCKVCQYTRKIDDEQANPERKKARSARSYQRHKEKRKAEARQYYEENREAQLAKRREWYVKNRKRMLVLGEAYYQANKERFFEWRDARRARLANAEGRYTRQDVKDLYVEQDGRCAYCNCELNGTYHVDHVIPLVRGGSNSPDNLALACPTCNLRKNSRTAEEFMEVLM